jgi:hypothetical protein
MIGCFIWVTEEVLNLAKAKKVPKLVILEKIKSLVSKSNS